MALEERLFGSHQQTAAETPPLPFGSDEQREDLSGRVIHHAEAHDFSGYLHHPGTGLGEDGGANGVWGDTEVSKLIASQGVIRYGYTDREKSIHIGWGGEPQLARRESVSHADCSISLRETSPR